MNQLVLRPTQGLTRAEAAALPGLLEFQSPSSALALTPVKGPARGTIWIVCTMVAALTAAAGLIPVDKVVTAHGRIVARDQTVVVQPLETAIVRSIDVREGQIVHAGDLLARLDPTFAAADLGALQQQVASLTAESERLAAESADRPYEPVGADKDAVLQSVLYRQRQAERTAKLENYRQRIASLEATAIKAQQDILSYRQRLEVAGSVENMRRELQQTGVGSRLNLLGATDARLEVERNLVTAARQRQSAEGELQAMRAERDGFDQNWRGQVSRELAEQGRKLADAREQLNKAVLRRQLVELRTEQDAVVLTVARVSVGSVLQSGDQFITLVPTGATLEVEANVAGTDAGFVRPGQHVAIKFDTFPYAQYGMAQGSVRMLSPDSFTGNPDASQRGAQQQQQSQPVAAFYRGRIALDQVALHDVPDGFRVTPGMPVTADVKVGRRTMLSYLVGRVLPVWLDSMREP